MGKGWYRLVVGLGVGLQGLTVAVSGNMIHYFVIVILDLAASSDGELLR